MILKKPIYSLLDVKLNYYYINYQSVYAFTLIVSVLKYASKLKMRIKVTHLITVSHGCLKSSKGRQETQKYQVKKEVKVEHILHEMPLDVKKNSHQRMLQEMSLAIVDNLVVYSHFINGCILITIKQT